MSLVVDEHREYLSDPVRLDAFRAAIEQAVRPGDVVLDLASGTGILGLFACRAGASRVYSIEATGMMEIARAIAEANGVAARIAFVRGVSRHVTLPERVDVIVCDQIGHFGFEAGLLDDGVDARRRFLKPDGRFVPGRVELLAAPVQAAPLHAQVEFWRSRPAGFDCSPARAWAVNTGYPSSLDRDALLGPAQPIAAFDMHATDAGPLSGEVTLAIDRPGTLHGIAGWFEATLAPGVTLTNAPTASARLNRRNVFLPIDRAVDVQAGDLVRVRVYIIPAETILTWRVIVERGGAVVAESHHSTVHGMLLSRSDLRRTDPRFVPELTARGRARQSVLELCDGRRRLDEIEREMVVRHPDLFASLADAAVFVGEVVAVYADA